MLYPISIARYPLQIVVRYYPMSNLHTIRSAAAALDQCGSPVLKATPPSQVNLPHISYPSHSRPITVHDCIGRIFRFRDYTSILVAISNDFTCKETNWYSSDAAETPQLEMLPSKFTCPMPAWWTLSWIMLSSQTPISSCTYLYSLYSKTMV